MKLHNQNGSWSACEPGTLANLSKTARRQRLQRRTWWGGVSAVGAVGLVVAVSLLSSPWQLNEFEPGFVDRSNNIAETDQRFGCREVLEQCDPYLLGHLPNEELEIIKSHLSHCPRCVIAYRQRAEELNREFSVLLTPPVAPAPTRQLLAHR